MDDAGLTIRPALPADTTEITSLVHCAFQHYIARIGRRPAPMDSGYAGEISAGMVWVAEQDNHLRGLAEVRLSTNEKMTENLAHYPRRGYREVGRGLRAGFARVHFSKRVRGPAGS